MTAATHGSTSPRPGAPPASGVTPDPTDDRRSDGTSGGSSDRRADGPSAGPSDGSSGPATTTRVVRQDRYGPPEVLELAVRPLASPSGGEVLVRVHAADASIGDVHLVTGKPYLVRAVFGLRRPRTDVRGQAIAGVVEAVGAGVEDLAVGDEVFGEIGSGAFADRVVVPAERLLPKPSALSFEEAATLPWAVTALQALRDTAGLESGQRVLVIGASGGVGTFAVQIAKALGADVTGVCSSVNVERIRALGADHVIDYTERDFAREERTYDVVLDLVGERSVRDITRVLERDGTYVSCSGLGGDWFGPLLWLARIQVASWFRPQRLTTFLAKPNRADLEVLAAMAERGELRPVIDRTYSLEDVVEAMRYLARGHARGKVVVTP